MGDVLPFVRREPETERRLCFNCDHSLSGVFGVYCQLFHEEIVNERTAEVCDEFVL